MSGVKGLSGRKCLRDEEKRLRILEKSWDVIETYLNDPNITLKLKAELASKLVVKEMPTQLEGSLNVTMMPTVKIDDKPQEINIG